MTKKIIIVEDQRVIVESVKLALEDLRLDITVRYNGSDAMELLEKEVFDLLILDIYMKKPDGMEILENLRNSINSQCPVVIISSEDNVQVKLRAKELGAAGFQNKPIVPQRINQTVRELLKL